MTQGMGGFVRSPWFGWWFHVAVLVISLPSMIRAVTDPSPWRSITLVVWTLLLMSVIASALRALRVDERVTPRNRDRLIVPFDDVVAALEEGTDREDAVELLRARHPGLGSLEAQTLVDEVLARPDR